MCAPPAASRRGREGRAEPRRERSRSAASGRRGLRDPAPSAAGPAGRRGTGAAAPPLRPAPPGRGAGRRARRSPRGRGGGRCHPAGRAVPSRPVPLRSPRGGRAQKLRREPAAAAPLRGPALLRSRAAGLRSLAAPAVQPSLPPPAEGEPSRGQGGRRSPPRRVTGLIIAVTLGRAGGAGWSPPLRLLPPLPLAPPLTRTPGSRPRQPSLSLPPRLQLFLPVAHPEHPRPPPRR